MLHTTFLSYSRRDLAAVDQIAERLAGFRVPVWLDRRDLPVSLPWFDEVKAVIEAADLVVVCDSPDWKDSTACQLELKAAQAVHKTICTVDVRTSTPDAATEMIMAMVRGTSPRRWAHTEVTARAAIWARAGRTTGSLIGGRLLRQAIDVLRAGDPPLSPATHQYIVRSIRRRRYRRWTAVIAGLLTVATTVVFCLGAVLLGLLPDELERRDALVEPLTVRDQPAFPDPYAEIAAARARVLDGTGQAWLNRTDLARKLAAPLPDVSYPLASRIAGFAGSPRGARATVADDRGRLFTGTDATGTVAAAALRDIIRAAHNARTTSRDGRRVAVTAAGDGIVRVFTRSGARLTFLRAVTVPGAAGPTSFSPDGRFLAVAAGPGVTVVDIRTGLTVADLRGSVGVARALTWSADGGRVWAVAGADRVTSWPWRSGRVIVDDPARGFVALAGPADDGLLAAVDRGGRVSLVNPARAAVPRTIATGAREVTDADLSRDGRTLVLATTRGLVVHATDRGTERTIPTSGCTVVDLAVDESGERAYVACPPAGVRVYALADGRLLSSADIPVVDESSVTLHAKDAVFVGDSIGELHRYDRQLGHHRRLVDGTCMLPARRVDTDRAGTTVVFAGDGPSHHTCMYQAQLVHGRWQRNLHQLPPGPGKKAHAVALAPDGATAVIGLSDGTVYLWRIDSLDPIGTHHDFGGEVRGAAFSRDGGTVLVASEDGLLEQFPACTQCGSADELARQASDILNRATAMGLYAG